MHYASREDKRLLHNGTHYARHMSTPAERLRIARLRAGYTTGKEAAEALGFPVSTYLAHENGSRGITASRAVTYARRYKVREQWLLYGVGPGPGSEQQDQTAEIVNLAERMAPERRAEALRILRILSGEGGA
jgi:transcriptional regulator with XRE-family HTH domain